MFNNNYEDPYYKNYDHYGLSYYSEPWRSMRKEMRRLGGGNRYDRDFGTFDRFERDFGRYEGGNRYDRDFGMFDRDFDRSNRSLMDRNYYGNNNDYNRYDNRSLMMPSSQNWDRSLMPSSENWDRSLMPTSENWDRSLMPSSRMFSPKWDVSETEKEIIINAEIPGLTRDQINIDVDQNNRLHVFGNKTSQFEDKNNKVHRIERSYGSFRRTLGLPHGVDPQSIQASYENGLLRICVPKSSQGGLGLNRPVNITDRNLNQQGLGSGVNVQSNQQGLGSGVNVQSNQPTSTQAGKDYVVGQPYGNQQSQYSKQTDLSQPSSLNSTQQQKTY